MNRVIVGVKGPEPFSLKRGQEDIGGPIEYAAAFHIETNSRKKPIHYGPTISVSVVDEDGNVITCNACTAVVQDKGNGNLDIQLQNLKPVLSSAEEGDQNEEQDEEEGEKSE